jgi:RND superfamily putative drug exporter
MARLARFVTGRRTKWVVLAFWIVLVVVFAPLGSKLADATDDRTESQLPKNAESTEVLRLQQDRFASGQTTNGLIVYQRDGGLTRADQARIKADAVKADRAVLPGKRNVTAVPFSGQEGSDQLVSREGDLAYTVMSVPNDNKKLADWGKDVRKAIDSGTSDESGGLNVYVSGNLGVNADFEEVFSNFDTKLLAATVLLVITLLLLIYRAPLIALVPILVVGFAYTVAQGFIYLYADSGATVTQNATSILVVLMFGVGTDYCLLLVSRYREELHSYEDKHEAMEHALLRAGPAILASGMTVILSMLVLLFAEVGGIHSMGPASAIGIACVLLAGLTLLPALLTIFGRPGFWPRRRLIAYDPEHKILERQGLWRRLGDSVLRRPGLALLATVILFTGGALGLLAYKESYSTTNFFKKSTESVDGFKALEASTLPAGNLDPTNVLVERENGPVTPADIAKAKSTLEGVEGIDSVSDPLETSTDKRIASLNVVFADDPYTSAAFDRVPVIRDRLDQSLPPEVSGLVGGGSAVSYDYDKANKRDLKVIVPLALLVIGVILGVLLRAVVAPIVLILSVVASFFGTLGLSILFFRFVADEPGIDNSLPTFAFIFLVALGVDYTIFLMSRVREEAAKYGTREGTLRALTATGPVITSAGIILAGTFSVLMTVPVTFAFNIGFMVALGILLDTFIVRTIMVPAAIELLGDRIWWPSTAKGGGGALRERSSDSHPQLSPEPAPAASE